MQALWGAENNSGASSDIIAAIEDAIKDGADILSYSVGSGATATFRDDVIMAFMNAGASSAQAFLNGMPCHHRMHQLAITRHC
jgi:hypothetical protein